MALDRFVDLSIPRDANGRPASVVFGYDPVSDIFYPLAVEDVGDGTFRLKVKADLAVGDIEIGAVELKDASSDVRVIVRADGKVLSYSDDNPLEKKNITTLFTYVVAGNGIGKVATMKEYPSGAAGGTAAKLTTFSYDANNKVSSMVVTDTTV